MIGWNELETEESQSWLFKLGLEDLLCIYDRDDSMQPIG